MLSPVVYFAIPVMDEIETLPKCLECIASQTYPEIRTVICVNQPENFRYNSNKQIIVQNNEAVLKNLSEIKNPNIMVIDKSSAGKGWTGKKHGVGWARKTVMDAIVAMAKPNDVIISMDADTTFGANFCSNIVNKFNQYPEAVGMALPYYHNLGNDDNLNRAVLRYEIYMRYYAINLWRINNPYSFTAIGSSMCTTVRAYNAIGGISPKLSGEDFYFLQKLRKYGSVIVWNDESTYPSGRLSDRVFFGTGPALIKGIKNDWDSYPIYPARLFDEVKSTFDSFDILFETDIETPMTAFLKQCFNTIHLWQSIRDNYKNKKLFRKSCVEKVDALRILQYLKSEHSENSQNEILLLNFLWQYYPEHMTEKGKIFENLNLDDSPIELLNELRNLLMRIEYGYRRREQLISHY